MTNDQYREIETAVGRGQGLTPAQARLLLDQLQANAVRAVRVNKELSDARAKAEAVGAELAALARAASLAWEETELLIDDEYERLMDTLAPRMSEAIARAHRHLAAGTVT